MPLNIFLVEDHEIVRKGLKALLEDERGFAVCGEASDGAELLKDLAQGSLPDIVLMDLNMPVMSGLESTRELKLRYPQIKVLVLSMHDHESYLIDMLDAGADGYVLKNASRAELVFAIRQIIADGTYIGTEFTMTMLTKYKSSQPQSSEKNVKPKIDLSPRDLEVLELIAQGFTNMEIANKLFTSVRTIETRRKKLLEKTGTTNTATLIRFATLNQLIS
ncbi:MAG: response regulator [Bacteroidia bacterium]